MKYVLQYIHARIRLKNIENTFEATKIALRLGAPEDTQ